MSAAGRGDTLAKYFARHAELRARDPSVAELAACGPWDHAVVVPARREALGDCLAVAAALGPGALTVLVVNAADDSVDQAAAEVLMAALEERPCRWQGPGMRLCSLADGRALMAVDGARGAWRFGPRDGVGRARKLGCDLVAGLIAAGSVVQPWIHSSDADARLPAEHCQRVIARAARAPRPSAIVAPFWHAPGEDEATNVATARYELELRYYVAGLKHAGSPFAYHTIGSTISAACWAYAAVRGFPRREAGEDFYLLDKLAKLDPVATVAGAPVEIRSRRSTRVPFGTGPAVEALCAGVIHEVYDPRVFDVVAAVERALDVVVDSGAFEGFAALEPLAPAELGRLAAAIERARTRYPAAQLRRRLRESFDGFRTLKLIHELSNRRWPRVSWPEAVRAAPFIDFDPADPLDDQRRALADLEAR